MERKKRGGGVGVGGYYGYLHIKREIVTFPQFYREITRMLHGQQATSSNPGSRRKRREKLSKKKSSVKMMMDQKTGE